MIGSLAGEILAVIKQSVILQVNGVGYRVLVPSPYFGGLKSGDKVLLYTHLQVREDAHVLFGFKTLKELDFFEQLLTVSDVGPKSALGILALGSVEDIEQAILRQDLSFLTNVSGIGKKTAEKIMIGLKDKLGDKGLKGAVEQGGETGELFDALTQMGYRPQEIRDTLKSLHGEKGTTEEKLKKALRMLGK
ncbi:MAG TPA: Holliday junction branch migration protein RuvA [Patescibacteria group bacterium]|nr:Holliday junction branch migration protein RuvA [Patescibacteria group bacterium]